jgi:gluconolactonase
LFVCNPSLGVVRVGRNGRHEIFASEVNGAKLVTPNFGVFAADGTLFLTDSGNWKKRNGRVLRFDAAGSGRDFAASLGYANGLALSADGRTLYMVESDTNSVLRFGVGPDGLCTSTEVFARDVGRLPDGAALDASGNVYVSCYASDDIHRLTPAGGRSLFAYDPFAILLSRPTNMAFDDEWMYVANLGRTTVTRAKLDVHGQKLVNRR